MVNCCHESFSPPERSFNQVLAGPVRWSENKSMLSRAESRARRTVLKTFSSHSRALTSSCCEPRNSSSAGGVIVRTRTVRPALSAPAGPSIPRPRPTPPAPALRAQCSVTAQTSSYGWYGSSRSGTRSRCTGGSHSFNSSRYLLRNEGRPSLRGRVGTSSVSHWSLGLHSATGAKADLLLVRTVSICKSGHFSGGFLSPVPGSQRSRTPVSRRVTSGPHPKLYGATPPAVASPRLRSAVASRQLPLAAVSPQPQLVVRSPRLPSCPTGPAGPSSSRLNTPITVEFQTDLRNIRSRAPVVVRRTC